MSYWSSLFGRIRHSGASERGATEAFMGLRSLFLHASPRDLLVPPSGDVWGS
jgi:hypothetical protein